MKIPNEDSEEIQEILKSDCDNRTKSARIENYYKKSIPYNRHRGTKQKLPEWHFGRIWIELNKRDLQSQSDKT